MNKKAVSPVIATLLMIALAVSASIIVYVWSTSLLGNLMVTGNSQSTKEALSLEAYDWTSYTSLKFTIRNIGTAPVMIATAYLNGSPQAFGVIAIPVGGTYTTTISVGVNYYMGQAYMLKFVSVNGGIFAYSLICGQTG